jgi:hypothetical protein
MRRRAECKTCPLLSRGVPYLKCKKLCIYDVPKGGAFEGKGSPLSFYKPKLTFKKLDPSPNVPFTSRDRAMRPAKEAYHESKESRDK